MSCPVFEGNRLYYRAMDHLYCIAEVPERVGNRWRPTCGWYPVLVP